MLQEAGVGDRVRLLYPEVDRRRAQRPHTMVHSKVMIVDDRLLRIGSANLNNRSMGTDTECDLAIEARNEAERARHRDDPRPPARRPLRRSAARGRAALGSAAR